MNNIDQDSVNSFGNEWKDFDQSKLSSHEAKKVFEEYFSIFPWKLLNDKSKGFDMGCGSGRWARLVAPRVGPLNCIDPSEAIKIAKKNLSYIDNVSFYKCSVDDECLPKSSQDFGYSLGVLHHVPDTEKAIKSCVSLLKPGAPLLLYLYYKFDNRPYLYRVVWNISDIFRRIISKLPFKFRSIVTNIIAAIVYFPFAKISLFLDWVGVDVSSIPLSYYRNHSFYTMKTDSRDRFGTPLEHRFTKVQIEKMMQRSGLTDIKFSNNAPYWCAVGIKL